MANLRQREMMLENSLHLREELENEMNQRQKAISLAIEDILKLAQIVDHKHSDEVIEKAILEINRKFAVDVDSVLECLQFGN